MKKKTCTHLKREKNDKNRFCCPNLKKKTWKNSQLKKEEYGRRR